MIHANSRHVKGKSKYSWPIRRIRDCKARATVWDLEKKLLEKVALQVRHVKICKDM